MPPDEAYCGRLSQYVEKKNPENQVSQDLSYCILSTSAEKERAEPACRQAGVKSRKAG